VKKATIATTMGPGIPVDPNKTRGFIEDEEPAAV
jgi:large subunit ribosomal protein L1